MPHGDPPATSPLGGTPTLDAIGEAYTHFSREVWAQLRPGVSLTLAATELEELRGAGDPLSPREVDEIYLPLTRLINLHVEASRRMARVADDFLGRPGSRRPYIIAIAGSVAVGKSTVARLLQRLLSHWSHHPHVDLVATDGFLHPTAVLRSRGLLERKGFPESYDIRRMIDFLRQLRATGEGALPVYSHEAYDILGDRMQLVSNPDILIFEGLNVLQLGTTRSGAPPPVLTAADFFDLSIYVDAESADIEQWYIDRFLLLKRTVFSRPGSSFHHLAAVGDDDARAFARGVWNAINLPNLETNILPTRTRADLIIHKRGDHSVDHLWLRRF